MSPYIKYLPSWLIKLVKEQSLILRHRKFTACFLLLLLLLLLLWLLFFFFRDS